MSPPPDESPPDDTGPPPDRPSDLLPVEVTAALDEIHRLVGVVQRCAFDQLGRAGLESYLAGVLQQAHRLHASVVRAVASARDTQAYREDGHRSVHGWVRWAGRLCDRDTALYAGAAHAFDHLPAWRAAFESGVVGIAQLREIVRLWHNPTTRDALAEVEDRFVTLAQTCSHQEFTDHCRRFALLAAPQDADADHHAAHERRDTRLRPLPDGGFHLAAQHGHLQGAAMREILDRFIAEEYSRETTRREAGDPTRTPAQVRADALYELFQKAASTPADARRPEPLVNIVMTVHEFEAVLQAAASAEPVHLDANRFEVARIETRDGTIVSPRDVFAAAVDGWVRRVVVDPAGHVIDLGRRQRLFTGAARDAALHAASRCSWASGACQTGNPYLQVDHLDPARAGGTTDQANASPQCGYHNRYKEQGYTVRRDADTGRFVTYRPDGSPITPPPPPR
jgi:hypothetical protein